MDAKAGNRTFYLPRLGKERYRGDTVILWTLPVAERQTGWLDDRFHARFRELMLHTCARQGLVCPVYVLMPDHVHLVWMSVRPDSDQRNGMAFFRRYLEPELGDARFQHQAHDHLFKNGERRRNAFAKVCWYVLMNPVRAELAATPKDWSFMGCMVPGYPEIDPRDEGYWSVFWRVYMKLKDARLAEV